MQVWVVLPLGEKQAIKVNKDMCVKVLRCIVGNLDACRYEISFLLPVHHKKKHLLILCAASIERGPCMAMDGMVSGK
jgi:hypothetical protein